MSIMKHRSYLSTGLLIGGLILIGASLRAPVTGVAPILETIQSTFDLSPAHAGMLTTLPLLAFGVLSPFGALLAREYGLERALFGSLMITIIGIVVRSSGPLWCLYLGTATLGAGIAVSTVLLPGVFKRDFPKHVPVMTGLGAISIGIGAAAASASSVPLTELLGWQVALGSVAIFPIVAIVTWSAQLRRHSNLPAGSPTPPHGGPMWRSSVAWCVTLFMGVTSLLYYVFVGWLPLILTDSGYSAAEAGSLHGAMQIAWSAPGLILGPIVGRITDQKLLTAATAVLTGVGVAGLLAAPQAAALWVPCIGLGTGSGMLLALIFIGLRTSSAQDAAALSGMVQCVGNLLAAVGPPVVGKLHDLTGSWAVPLLLAGILSFAMLVFGALAGRSNAVNAR